MRPRPRPLLVLGFVLIMAALMYVQAPPNPQLSRALKDAAERLKAYYRGNPVPENWKITGVSTGADDVWVDFSLPGGEAAALVQGPRDKMVETIGAQCPVRTDIVWRVLSPTQGIEIRARAAGKEPFIAVNSRAFGQ